jgi:hypothetical protein
MALKHPPSVHPKAPVTGKGQKDRPPNNLPNSNYQPKTGKS